MPTNKLQTSAIPWEKLDMLKIFVNCFDKLGVNKIKEKQKEIYVFSFLIDDLKKTTYLFFFTNKMSTMPELVLHH